MMSEVREKGKLAKEASYTLNGATTEEKNEALRLIAAQVVEDKATILAENEKDIQAGKEDGLTDAILDRILLDEDRLDDMAHAITLLVDLNDPIGEVLEKIEKENGLKIQKKRVPLGVVGMIYEARPNVTLDAATLSLKTGNAVVLRGSSAAKHSNIALVNSIHKALAKSSLPVDAVQLIEDTSRETAKDLFQLNEYLDVLIPRGGEKLIETVVRESIVPVIATGAGNSHIYIDESAEQEMAQEIILNAKLQRPGVCNAVETILFHEDWFENYGSDILERLLNFDVELYADEKAREYFPEAKEATEEDWYKEYLDLAVSVKVVSSTEEAIAHINKYGTHHSDAIVTENDQNANVFLQNVDSTSVYHNASTRFTDGFEFGYGAEIGISTQKLHARGPMGLNALTSSKFVIQGNGQIRE